MKGTPNKITQERKELLDLFLKDHFNEFVERMSSIESPVDYCRIYVQLLNFVMPKIASVAIKEEPYRESLAEELDRICGFQ